MKAYFSAFLVLLPAFLIAQKFDSTKNAKVIVIVTNRDKVAAPNEEIVFTGVNTGKNFTGITKPDGKFTFILPAGDQYTVKVKALNDTTAYGMIDIPMPGAGQFYQEPFKVDIEFEPARKYTLDDVHFDFGKATLRAESYEELEELYIFLKRKPHIEIEIAGHSDNIGNDEDNLRLSQQRANSIKSFLVRKGIDPTRISAKGYGASEPIADNNTAEGRQLNRRTEVRLLD